MKRLWLITVPAIVLAGMASGWLSGSGYGDPWFDALRKPWFMPPGWVFPVVWTTLYVLMGVALSDLLRARTTGGRGEKLALGLFAAQLVLNLAWSPLFFGAHKTAAALGLIVALDVAVLATIVAASNVRVRAGWLLVPYAAWLGLATALNWAILRLNP